MVIMFVYDYLWYVSVVCINGDLGLLFYEKCLEKLI